MTKREHHHNGNSTKFIIIVIMPQRSHNPRLLKKVSSFSDGRIFAKQAGDILKAETLPEVI